MLTEAEMPQAKESLASMHAGSLQLFPTLCDPVDCGLPGFSVRGAFPGKNTGVGCHTFLEHYISSPAALGASYAEYLVLPGALWPKKPHHLHTWHSMGVDPSPLGPASGANPSGWPTCRGGDKATTETQGQCSWGRGPKTFPPAVQGVGPTVLEGILGRWGGLWLPAKERMLTAETQEKHLLFLYFNLFCSFFGIFFSFSSPPPHHLCSCQFY